MPLQSSRTKSYAPPITASTHSHSSFSSSRSSASLRSSPQSSPSVSPNRSLSYDNKNNALPHHRRKRTCLCSPTTHLGSFRCPLHKGFPLSRNHPNAPQQSTPTSFNPGSPLNLRRLALKNSLIRIGELVKRTLTARITIRPSSHQQRRPATFHPRPSRLSIMSKADDSSTVLGFLSNQRAQ
ncbi:putative disease resistance protein [Hibiscus syriacus]|uniref:Disease resistance protein n=1 Tax=Hibiscus syriacus TaxID=106335 RepID=A0A6A3AXJ6_HIBSY|nr:uncharacterized protein LOC120120043 [Hibiscus syriacus]KAE8709166.1 putative disease resistance protein [Hibiscus syriacus]